MAWEDEINEKNNPNTTTKQMRHLPKAGMEEGELSKFGFEFITISGFLLIIKKWKRRRE